MAEKKAPRKPSRPLAHAVFPQKGQPHVVVETLPLEAKALEATIVRKFIGALAQFEERQLDAAIVEGDRWPDFITRESGAPLGIELVEVINADYAAKRRIQERYAALIEAALREVMPRLAGLTIQLEDGYQDPPYPPPSSVAGRRLARSIATRIVESLDALEALPPGKLPRYFTWRETAPKAGAFVRRIAPRESGVPPRLAYPGTFPESVRDARLHLARAVEGKMAKEYPRYSGSLILLAYSYDPLYMDAASVARTRRVLQERAHPFTEVWGFVPHADGDTGSLERLWPEPRGTVPTPFRFGSGDITDVSGRRTGQLDGH